MGNNENYCALFWGLLRNTGRYWGLLERCVRIVLAVDLTGMLQKRARPRIAMMETTRKHNKLSMERPNKAKQELQPPLPNTPSKARPKPRLSGQAGPEHQGTGNNNPWRQGHAYGSDPMFIVL